MKKYTSEELKSAIDDGSKNCTDSRIADYVAWVCSSQYAYDAYIKDRDDLNDYLSTINHKSNKTGVRK